MNKKIVLIALALLSISGNAFARSNILVVGSSTVYPFTTVVAEKLGRLDEHKTPVVESTGTGGGMKLFCAGVGNQTPDMTNASRAIKKSELELCASNNVTPIEMKVGYDGIVLANSIEAKQLDITPRQVYLALAKTVNGQPNPYTHWNQIDPSLPEHRIEVLGPPPTSGTRDAFVELLMEKGCKTFPEIKALKKKDKTAYKNLCHEMRDDGYFIEAGENDSLIVNMLKANPNSFGIFGFSFLDQNRDLIQGSVIGGVKPEFENIADGSYPVSRALYVYIKKEHLTIRPSIKTFVEIYMSDEAAGEFGYLADRGLIPMPKDELDLARELISIDIK